MDFCMDTFSWMLIWSSSSLMILPQATLMNFRAVLVRFQHFISRFILSLIFFPSSRLATHSRVSVAINAVVAPVCDPDVH